MEDGKRVSVWRWRIIGVGPHLAATLQVMEAVRRAAKDARLRAGYGVFPDYFHGGDGAGHKHAFWLPEDEDGDGLIDHIVMFCSGGVDAQTISGLALVREVELDGAFFRLAPSWMGSRPLGGLFGPAALWRAVTPYITPRYRLTKTGKERPDFTAPAQFADEIALRELPKPVSIEWRSAAWCGEDLVLASQFICKRKKQTGKPPGDAVASFPIVTFAKPVEGPLAFGYGAHFGMGLLMPADAD